MEDKGQNRLRRVVDEGERALRRFTEAVLTLSDDPSPLNVERYLIASRALEEARASQGSKRRAQRAA